MYGSDAMAGVVILNPQPAAPVGQILGNVSSEYQTNNGLFDYSLNLQGNQNGFIWGGRYSEKKMQDILLIHKKGLPVCHQPVGHVAT